MHTNYPILFLDRAEYDLRSRTILAAPCPGDCIPTQPIPEVTLVELMKDRLQVEIPAGARGLALGKGELRLHRQFRICGFAFLSGHFSSANKCPNANCEGWGNNH